MVAQASAAAATGPDAGAPVAAPAAPAAPAAAGPVAAADAFSFADAPSAQAAWRAMWGTAPVSVGEVEGRKAVRFPCNFAGTRIERASWDRSVPLDLTACRGVEFKVFCREASPVSHFTIFFESGDGWYAAAFSPTGKGEWGTVRIDKADTRIEGRPGGWAAVRTIRVSAWRGTDVDTEFYLADFAPVGGSRGIALVRGESAARNAPGELESVCEYAGTVARCLRDLGIEYSLVSDVDLSAERLKGVRLAILPHNPGMPDAAAETLAAFAAGGGKVIAFYTLSGKLREVAGVSGGEHVGQKYPGHFASIRFEGPELDGVPQVVAQSSWNIQGVKPVEGRSRAAARWFDKDGKDTGYPAVIVSDSIIYMTHVLVSENMAAKRRMLLAMVGRFLPEAWKQAAEARASQVRSMGEAMVTRLSLAAVQAHDAGRVQPAGTARAPLGPWRTAAAPLEKALAENAEAEWLIRQGRCIEALDQCDKAQRLLTEGWCLAQRPAPGEFRAMWCHSAFGPAGMEWDAAIKVLAENGFTAVLPNMLWGGTAYYESSVLPVAPEVKEKGDQIATCLAACRKYGVQCHVWKVNWNLSGRAPREFRERLKQEGRTQVGFDGKPQDGWLCPSHPENRKLEVAAMVEVATKYAVDGIHFDYIRYPDAEHCFCAGCRERFQEVIGGKVENWPAAVRKDETLRAKWLDFRRSNITAVVAAVSEQVRKARPTCRISAAVFSNWPLDRDGVGQDWRLWCERGYLDFVCPMDYTPQTATFESLVGRQLGWAGRVPCYPGIGLSTWQPPTDVVTLIEQITAARRLGAKGFTIFEFNAASAREVVPLLGKGITRKE